MNIPRDKEISTEIYVSNPFDNYAKNNKEDNKNKQLFSETILTRTANRHNFLDTYRDFIEPMTIDSDISMGNEEYQPAKTTSASVAPDKFTIPPIVVTPPVENTSYTNQVDPTHYFNYTKLDTCVEPTLDLMHLKDLNAPPPGKRPNKAQKDTFYIKQKITSIIFCTNVKQARQILSSDSEYGDLNCVYVAAKHCNVNVCVHMEIENRGTKFRDMVTHESNEVIHLHLKNNHYAPYLKEFHPEWLKMMEQINAVAIPNKSVSLEQVPRIRHPRPDAIARYLVTRLVSDPCCVQRERPSQVSVIIYIKIQY